MALASLVLLALLDQMRWQPWVYQYLLLFIIIALHHSQGSDEQSTRLSLSLLQLIVAMLYLWSGVHKLNYSFIYQVLPQLLAPFQNYLPIDRMPLVLLGICLALSEIFIGCGLLFQRTRKLAICLALVMHAVVLVLLIAKRYNTVVWPWNIALSFAVLILFWRSDTNIWQTCARWRECRTFERAAQVLAITVAVLPILSFWGWWDLYLSGALYSGKAPVAVVRVNERISEKLPETAKQQLFTTESNERMLPVFEWSLAALNVPPDPEARVFRQITREVCKLAQDNSEVELIIRESPDLLDGSYRVKRISCSQLAE